MKIETAKKQAAYAAVEALENDALCIGVGTGSTVRYVIEALTQIKSRIEYCIPSSEQTRSYLKAMGLPVVELVDVASIDVYLDGADEVTRSGLMIKGQGGALTQEKIVASASKAFWCVVDRSKMTPRLGKKHPVAIEVLPMARSLVARQLIGMGADPIYRADCVTDNGFQILDVYHLNLNEPMAMELKIQQIPGVLECGIFSNHHAQQIFVGSEKSVEFIRCS